MLGSQPSAPAPSYVPPACNGSRGDVWCPSSSHGDWEFSRKLPQSADAAHCGWVYCRCHSGRRNLVCVERLGRFLVLGRVRLATRVFEDAGTRKRRISAKRKVIKINKFDGFPKAYERGLNGANQDLNPGGVQPLTNLTSRVGPLKKTNTPGSEDRGCRRTEAGNDECLEDCGSGRLHIRYFTRFGSPGRSRL